ncbi:MAG: tRNA lysidine(34) synthetase TilS [bacterium]
MFKKISRFLADNSIELEGKRIIAGFSGGPDSMLLIHYLLHLRQSGDVVFRIMHLNHCERPQSDSEESFVSDFCRKHDIALSLYKHNIPVSQQAASVGFEMAARNKRLELFEHDMRKFNYDYVLTGHNMTDRIETFLINMERGSGLNGLVAMKVKRDRFIKPLLFLTKSQITDWLDRNEIEYITDKTNRDESFARNRIRHNIIPVLEEYMEGGLPGIADTLDILEQYSEAMEFFAGRYADDIITQGHGDIILDIDRLIIYNNKISKILIYYALNDLYNLNSGIISEIDKIARSRKQSLIKQFKPFTVMKDYNRLTVTADPIVEEAKPEAVKLEPGSEIRWGDYTIAARWTQSPHFDDINTVCLPSESFKSLTVRRRQAGDRFRPFGLDGTVKISRYLMNRKIPAVRRSSIPLIVNEKDEILWIAGYRRTDKYRINSQKEILEIYVREDKQTDR